MVDDDRLQFESPPPSPVLEPAATLPAAAAEEELLFSSSDEEEDKAAAAAEEEEEAAGAATWNQWVRRNWAQLRFNPQWASWNPLRAFVERLQNLAANAPPLPAAPRLDDFIPRFVRNWSFPQAATAVSRSSVQLEDDDINLFGNMPVAPPRSALRVVSAESMAAADRQRQQQRLFLDRYSEEELWSLFSTYRMGGLGKHRGKTAIEALEKQGYTGIELQIDVTDPFVHKLNVYAAHMRPNGSSPASSSSSSSSSSQEAPSPCSPQLVQGEAATAAAAATTDTTGMVEIGGGEKRFLLMQLFVRRETTFSVMETKSFTPQEAGVPKYYTAAFDEGISHLREYFSEGGRGGAQRLQMLVVEWLRMQNPRKQFASDRMPLPGQMHPGLGLGIEMDHTLSELATRSSRDGILNIPEHWYNAYFYSKGFKQYRFLNPAFEGFFKSICDAIEPDVQKKGLSTVAWAIFRGMLSCIVPKDPGVVAEDTQGQKAHVVRIRWVPQEQVCPLSPRMREYFSSAGYKRLVARFYHPELFCILWDAPGTELSASWPSLPSGR